MLVSTSTNNLFGQIPTDPTDWRWPFRLLRTRPIVGDPTDYFWPYRLLVTLPTVSDSIDCYWPYRLLVHNCSYLFFIECLSYQLNTFNIHDSWKKKKFMFGELW